MKTTRLLSFLAILLLGLAGAPMAQAISATGGVVTNAGTYTVHIFTNSGTFTVTSPGVVEVLLVAGGGGGGGGLGGGGGGGGVIAMPSVSLANGAYSVTVGAGGNGGGPGQANGNNGGNASAFGATAAGGGGGGHYSDVGGLAGGSGGGAGSVQGGTPSGGAATGSSLGGNTGTIYGNRGGNQTADRGGGDPTSARGGGGAGAAGADQNPQNTPGGDGGIGIANTILGINYYWGGGGGGAGHSGYNGGNGGLGGGGGGSCYEGSHSGGTGGGSALNPGLGATSGQDHNGGGGGANTGGGGGGGTWMNSTGGKGGSGIVIVKYLAASDVPVLANSTASNVTSSAAFLNGSISLTGNAPVTAVAVYWGTADGGTNTTLWANTNAFEGGPWDQGAVLTTNITTLAAGQDCFYTYSASNASGTAMALPSQYLITGDLNVYAIDPLFGSNSLDTATFTVTRPGTCTSNALPFNYTLSGTATNGVDYTASWSGGSPVIPAGQTTATLTLTPLINANNFGGTRSLVVTLNPGPYVIGAAGSANGTFQSFPMYYTWNNAKNGVGSSILDPANWIPAGQFLNLLGEICDINAGGVAGYPYFAGTVPLVAAQINVNSNAILTSGFYDAFTFANLHLRGGTLVAPDDNYYYGHIFVDNASVLDLRDAGDGVKMLADFSGSANLCVSNGLTSAGRYTWWPFTGNNPTYSGVWSFYNTWPGRFYFAGNMGSGGLNFTPMSSNICINVNTACPWTLDLRGAQVLTGVSGYPDGGTANPIHSGTFTLLSDAIIRAGGDGAGLIATINGRITGPGRLGTRAASEDQLNNNRSVAGNALKLGGANDYSGGTVVMTNILEAAAATCLGTGNVEIQPGGKLQIDVSGAAYPRARLYLDNNGSGQGVMNLGASTSVLTTVSHAYIGGTGGWRAPSGYTELAPGLYTNGSAGVSGYLAGSGKLKVSPPSGTIMHFR